MSAYMTSAQKADGTWCYPEISTVSTNLPRNVTTSSSTLYSYENAPNPAKRQRTNCKRFRLFDSNLLSTFSLPRPKSSEPVASDKHVIKFTTKNSATRFWAILEMRQMIYRLLLVAPGVLKINDIGGCIECQLENKSCVAMKRTKCWNCRVRKLPCTKPRSPNVAMKCIQAGGNAAESTDLAPTSDVILGNATTNYRTCISTHILTTCHGVYFEAASVLYGQNKFFVERGYNLYNFGNNLDTDGPFDLFGFAGSWGEYAILGRWRLVKDLQIKMGDEHDRRLKAEERPSDYLSDIWNGLVSEFDLYLRAWRFGFKRRLQLDFSGLKFAPEDEFDIEPAFTKIASNLQTLELVGLSYKVALEKFTALMENCEGELLVL